MFYLLPLLKRIYECLPILHLTLHPQKLSNWLESIESPFVYQMVSMHLSDITEGIDPQLDDWQKEELISSINALEKYKNPLPILIFISSNPILKPTLNFAVKNMRRINLMYINNLQNGSVGNTPSLTTAPRTLGSIDKHLYLAKDPRQEKSTIPNDQSDFELLVKTVAKNSNGDKTDLPNSNPGSDEYISIGSADSLDEIVYTPDNPCDNHRDTMDLIINKIKAYLITPIRFDSISYVTPYSRNDLDPLESASKSILADDLHCVHASYIIRKMLKRLQENNKLLLDYLEYCETASIFFQHFEYWLEELAELLSQFVRDAREEGKINEASIPCFRNEIKKLEIALCPLIESTIKAYQVII